ncbi:MAG TPA: MarR family transcriptional regulator [Acidimicrobiaceae bacterium]|nr:MarR family transcriptional regulator [Acidimicrobiaceae bacterium]
MIGPLGRIWLKVIGALTIDSYEYILQTMSSRRAPFLGRYLPYLLRQADQTLSAPFYAALNRSGVARSEWRVLVVLEELGELRVAELATASLSPQPTVTHALQRLEERGLVTRTVSSEDRRQRVVAITAEGSLLTTALMDEATRLEAEALAGAGDLTELVRHLREVTAFLDSGAGAVAGHQAPAE